MATRDWERSETKDVLWGARKEVLAARSVLETIMDVLDPGSDERDAIYAHGHDYEAHGEDVTLLELLYEVTWKLGRANSAMREVSDRLKEVGDGVPADMPDSQGR